MTSGSGHEVAAGSADPQPVDVQPGLVVYRLVIPDEEPEQCGPFLDKCLENVTQAGGWANVVRVLLRSRVSDVFRDVFDTYWIVAGQSIRAQVKDDRVLVAFLRQVLPPYTGGAVRLYRGENTRAHTRGHVGFAWSSNIEVARGFASAVNATPWGGVLLEGYFPRSAIISGPNEHSVYLDEHQFTADPFAGVPVSVLERHPPVV